MSTSNSKSSEVSETDSAATHFTRRHPYNTRYSIKNPDVPRSPAKRKVKQPKTIQCIPNQNFSKGQEIRSLQDEDDSSMDYCFDPCPQAPKSAATRSIFCTIFFSCFYLLILGGISYLLYTQYLMEQDVKKLQEEIDKITGVAKKGPHVSKAKELDKTCREALNHLLKDPVGRPDFALESSGGRVISVDTIPLSSPRTFLGFNLCEGDHGPSSMIQATTSPGECWAFKGRFGKAVIQLIDDVLIDSVSLEHIPQTISPSGSIDTAPKDFKIWGLDRPHGNKKLLGQFTYANDGDVIQTFNIRNNSDYYQYIEFEILNNHGNEDFTCVYRIRVHGLTRKYK